MGKFVSRFIWLPASSLGIAKSCFKQIIEVTELINYECSYAHAEISNVVGGIFEWIFWAFLTVFFVVIAIGFYPFVAAVLWKLAVFLIWRA